MTNRVLTRFDWCTNVGIAIQRQLNFVVCKNLGVIKVGAGVSGVSL